MSIANHPSGSLSLASEARSFNGIGFDCGMIVIDMEQ